MGFWNSDPHRNLCHIQGTCALHLVVCCFNSQESKLRRERRPSSGLKCALLWTFLPPSSQIFKNATFSHHQRSNVPTSASEDFRPLGQFSGAFKRSRLSKPVSPLFWASEGLFENSESLRVCMHNVYIHSLLHFGCEKEPHAFVIQRLFKSSVELWRSELTLNCIMILIMKNVTGCSKPLLWHFYSMAHVTNVCVCMCVWHLSWCPTSEDWWGSFAHFTSPEVLLFKYATSAYLMTHFLRAAGVRRCAEENNSAEKFKSLWSLQYFFTVWMCTTETTAFVSLNFKPFVETFKLKIQTEALLLLRYVNR